MSVSRKVSREKLAELIQAGVPEAALVVPYQKTALDGQSPVILVTSGASVHEALTMQGTGSSFVLTVHTFVLHADPESGWNEQNAEDMLDLIESKIADVIAANRTVRDVWESITQYDPSLVDRVTVSGLPYLYELIALSVEVYA
jgi:hypothetical protein